MTYNEKDETYQKFNFKKTNSKKKRYSCGGYGGKCSNCKNTTSQLYGKNQTKNRILIMDSQKYGYFINIYSKENKYIL